MMRLYHYLPSPFRSGLSETKCNSVPGEARELACLDRGKRVKVRLAY